jgi:hypothetical protein
MLAVEDFAAEAMAGLVHTQPRTRRRQDRLKLAIRGSVWTVGVAAHFAAR